MKSLNKLRPELAKLTAEERIELCCKKLRYLHPIYLEASNRQNEISTEISYWSNLKYAEEYNLVKVTKLPAFNKPTTKSKKDNEPSLAELIINLSKMSEVDKDKLREQLLKD